MSSATIRSAVLAQAVSTLSAIEGVDAIYLSGSLAEKTDDQYSDIDLRVVTADGAYDAVRTLRAQLPTTWGPFLFHETVADNLTVSYYESLTKADVFYYPASSINPSPWFNLGTTILFDRHGVLRATITASAPLKFLGAGNDIVSHLQKCIAGLIESAKRACRGEAIYATHLLADAVHHLLISDDLMSNRAPLGSSKREFRVPGSLTDLLNEHLVIPPPSDRSRCFSALTLAALGLVDAAVDAGFCPDETASKLRHALEQLTLLSAGQ